MHGMAARTFDAGLRGRAFGGGKAEIHGNTFGARTTTFDGKDFEGFDSDKVLLRRRALMIDDLSLGKKFSCILGDHSNS